MEQTSKRSIHSLESLQCYQLHSERSKSEIVFLSLDSTAEKLVEDAAHSSESTLSAALLLHLDHLEGHVDSVCTFSLLGPKWML